MEDKDPEIAALADKIKVLQEKKAQEEEEQWRWEEEEWKAWEAVEKMRQEELEKAKAVEAKRRVAEVAWEQGVGQKQSQTLEMEADCTECT